MTKKLIGILIPLLLVAGLASADPEPVLISMTSETSSTATVTNTPAGNQFFYGWVDTVILDVTGIYTGTVEIVTAGDTGTGQSRQIFKSTAISADGIYPVRDIVTTTLGVDIANTPCLVPLYQDRIRAYAYGYGNGTNTSPTVKAYILIRREP